MREIAFKTFCLGILIQGFHCAYADEVLGSKVKESFSDTSKFTNVPSLNNDSLSKNGLIKNFYNSKKTVHSSFLLAANLQQPNNSKESKEVVASKIPSELEANNSLSIEFDDLSKLVESGNPTIKAASLRREQSEARLLAALSVWNPTIDLTSNGLPQYLAASHYTNPNVQNTDYKKSEEWKSSLSATLKWDIFNPTRNPQISAARNNFEKSKNSFLIASRDINLKSQIQYFNLQLTQAKSLIARNAVNSSIISLKDARLRNKALVATDLEVLEAETQLSRDRRLLNESIRAQNISIRSLASTLGLPQNMSPVAISPIKLIGMWDRTLEESIASAYRFSAELDNNSLDISIYNDKAKEARGESRPTISLVNTLSFSNARGQTEVVPPLDADDYQKDLTNTIGLIGKWRVFDSGKSRQLSRFFKKKAKEAEYNITIERNKIREKVEESYYALQASTQNIFSTSRDVLKHRKMLAISRMRFNAGVTTQREIVNSQRDLTQAEINFADAISAYNISIVQLQNRTGLDNIVACSDDIKSNQKKLFEDRDSVVLKTIPLSLACSASALPYDQSKYNTFKSIKTEDILDEKNIESFMESNQIDIKRKVKGNKSLTIDKLDALNDQEPEFKNESSEKQKKSQGPTLDLPRDTSKPNNNIQESTTLYPDDNYPPTDVEELPMNEILIEEELDIDEPPLLYPEDTYQPTNDEELPENGMLNEEEMNFEEPPLLYPEDIYPPTNVEELPKNEVSIDKQKVIEELPRNKDSITSNNTINEQQEMESFVVPFKIKTTNNKNCSSILNDKSKKVCLDYYLD